MSNGLVFDKAGHTYTYNGRVIPSVTTIIKEAGIVNTSWYTKKGATRGSKVHKLTEWYDKKKKLPPLGKKGLAYLKAYKAFLSDSGFIPDLIEEQVYNAEWQYAGTLDRTGTLGGTRVLIDIKSGAIPAWAGIQTAAYAGCLSERVTRYVLQLKDNGSYKLKKFDQASDFAVFKACVTIYKWKCSK